MVCLFALHPCEVLRNRLSSFRRTAWFVRPTVGAILLASLLLSLPLPGTGVGQASAAEALNLSQGWNFVSFPKLPSPTASLATVFANVASSVGIVWGYDNERKRWLYGRPGIDGDLLSSIEFGKGYWIYMTGPGSIDMTQWSAPASRTISVWSGWNLVGCTARETDISRTLSVDAIAGKWDVVWNWSGDQWFAKSVNDITAPVSPLTTIGQGKAYWVKIRAGEDAFGWQPPGIFLDPDGTVQSTVSVDGPAGARLTLNTGTRVAIADGAGSPVPLPSSELSLSLTQGSGASPGLPGGVNPLSQFDIGLAVDGIEREAWF